MPEQRDFLETLLDDVQYYGTLPDRTLRKIFQSDLATASGISKMGKLIDQLIAQMGRNYLDIHKQKLVDDEIIIGIEQRSTAQCASSKSEEKP